MRHWIKIIIVLLVLLGLGGGAAFWYFNRETAQALSYRTAQITRGDLLLSIGATGTVEPEEVVDVGAQVAGQIIAFGKDKNGKTVDYGSAVEEGTVLAQIDDTVYAADVAQATAQLAQTKAALQHSEADLEQMKAKLYQAQRDWERAQKLGPSEALAQTSYDAYKSAYEIAKANIAVGEADIVQSKASVAQAEAVLQRVQRNLSYCTIKSPVKGVIIDRRVNIGQTVVASLNAPSLFLMAKDLKRMQLWVAVNEADIGKIHPGQPVTFTVDAFPGETFAGEVGKIRLNASMTQNVVTYTVEILTDNSSGRLLPYLTANSQFELNRRNNVLLVPNAALRWMPAAEQIAPQFRNVSESPASRNATAQAAQRPTSKPAVDTGEATSSGVVWVPVGQYLRPVRVRAGISNGVNTEVEGKDLTEGLEVVTGLQTQTASQTETKNPFAPQIPRRSTTSSSSSGSGQR